MKFELSENHILFKRSIERFTGSFDNAARRTQRAQAEGFSRERWTTLAELGLLHVAVSEADGGMSGDALDCGIVAEALGYGLAAEPWLECGFWPSRLLAGHSALQKVLTGKNICAVAVSEPGRNGELSPQELIADRVHGQFRLSGRKTFVLGGAAADCFLVSALCHDGPAMFVVPRDATNVSVQGYRIIDGSRAVVLTLNGVMVPEQDRVHSGATWLGETIGATMLMASAEMAGLAHRLFDETLSYVKAREQFGQPIGRFQVVQHRMVDHYVALEKARSTLQWALHEPWTSTATIAGAKAFIAQLALSVAHDAVQLHGGMGVTDELLVGHALKRIVLLDKFLMDSPHGFAGFQGRRDAADILQRDGGSGT